MKGGIPQGSALGLLVFLVHEHFTTADTLLQYADDATLICSGSNFAVVAVTMSYQLQLVHSWIVDSRMVNSKKSCVMWFQPHHCRCSVMQPDIVINNISLQTTVKQKYLGLIFDNRLTWSYHVSSIGKKMSYYLHLVGLHKHVLPVSLINLVMDSLVLLHNIMWYALPVYMGPILVPTTPTTLTEISKPCSAISIFIKSCIRTL